MAIYDDKWFEFWYSEGDIIPTYFLIVTPDENEKGKIKVIDPLKSNEIVFRGNDYQAASDWLNEDDFILIEGRMFDDDGW